MRKLVTTGLIIAALSAVIAGCSTSPSTEGKKIDLESDARAAIAQVKAADPGITDKFFNDAYAYVVFPNVGKGGFVVGGAGGRGVVFVSHRPVGYATMSQASVGAQIGGQVYKEFIFFDYKEAYDHFKTGNFALAAQASAVAATAGASATADYDRGVAVFTLGEAGLMVEASVGGQKFKYEDK